MGAMAWDYKKLSEGHLQGQFCLGIVRVVSVKNMAQNGLQTRFVAVQTNSLPLGLTSITLSLNDPFVSHIVLGRYCLLGHSRRAPCVYGTNVTLGIATWGRGVVFLGIGGVWLLSARCQCHPSSEHP
jgi:hypothetical protein